MERLTKAALATGGAAALLLGGAGTLAFWTAEGTATGSDVVSGSLTMTDGECGDWTLDGGGPVVEGIVPGDTVTSECTLAVSGTGDHIALGDVEVSEASWVETNDLTAALVLDAASATLDGAPLTLPIAEPVAVNADSELVVTVSATFPEGATTGQGLTATLSDVTVTVTQDHLVPAAP
jgi:alternate signal-mediated exported protein